MGKITPLELGGRTMRALLTNSGLLALAVVLVGCGSTQVPVKVSSGEATAKPRQVVQQWVGGQLQFVTCDRNCPQRTPKELAVDGNITPVEPVAVARPVNQAVAKSEVGASPDQTMKPVQDVDNNVVWHFDPATYERAFKQISAP